MEQQAYLGTPGIGIYEYQELIPRLKDETESTIEVIAEIKEALQNIPPTEQEITQIKQAIIDVQAQLKGDDLSQAMNVLKRLQEIVLVMIDDSELDLSEDEDNK